MAGLKGEQFDSNGDSGEDISLVKQGVRRRGLRWRSEYLALIVFLIAVIITVTLFLLRNTLGALETYEEYGYLGLFLMCVASNATVILPVGGALAVFFSSGLLDLNPIIVGVVGGLGAGLGELTGYMAGYGGQAVIKNRSMYKKFEGWMRRRGFITIFVFSLIGFCFDLAGLAAGASRFPVWKFLLACWLGRILLYIGFAYAGEGLFPLVSQLFQGQYTLWAILVVGVVAVALVAGLVIWRQRKRRADRRRQDL